MYAIGPGEAGEVLQLYMLLDLHDRASDLLDLPVRVRAAVKASEGGAKHKGGNLDFEIRQESDDEIGQLCQDFEEMRMRLKSQAEERVRFDRENKELISKISHDLKTPITTIKGYVEGIMDGVSTRRTRWTDISGQYIIRPARWICAQ